MRQAFYLFLFLVFGTFLFPPNLHCADKKLTFTEAVKIALENNYELRAGKNALLAEKEGVGIARSYFFPRLSLEERATRTDNPPQTFMMKLNQRRFTSADFAIDALNRPDPVNDYQTSFVLEQPIFFMQSFRGLSVAKKAYAAKSGEYRRKKEETVLQTAEAYLHVQTAKERLKAAQKAAADAKEHLRIAQVRYKNEVGLYSDTLRAQTAVTRAEQALVSSEREYNTAMRRFGLVIASSGPVDAAEDDIVLAVKDLEYYQQYSKERNDLNAMKMQADMAAEKVRLAESAYFPYIGAMGAYQTNDHNNPFGSEGRSWLVSAYLRWDLFDGTRREFERGKAHHEAMEAKERLAGFKDLVAFRTADAYLAVEEAKKTLELAETALKSAEEGQRLVKSRYENSLSPMIDLLDAQLALDQARADVAARRNGYKLAVISLTFESGTIMNELNIEKGE